MNASKAELGALAESGVDQVRTQPPGSARARVHDVHSAPQRRTVAIREFKGRRPTKESLISATSRPVGCREKRYARRACTSRNRQVDQRMRSSSSEWVRAAAH